MVNPYGLTYLTASCDYAFFLDPFDNSIWLYSGARAISKGPVFSAKAAIQAGWYNDYDNALYLQTTNSIITVRDDTSVVENPLPFPSGTWNTFNTNLGIFYVQGANIVQQTYNSTGNLYGSTATLIPLSYQTGYLGYESNKIFQISKIDMRFACEGGLASTLNITWNWVTQDNSGTDTATITTTPLSTSNYFTCEFTPPHNQVLLFSLGITDASGTQKLVLLNVDVYSTYVGEAVISNQIQ